MRKKKKKRKEKKEAPRCVLISSPVQWHKDTEIEQ